MWIRDNNKKTNENNAIAYKYCNIWAYVFLTINY